MDVAALQPRPDVGAVYPGAGPDRGFAVDVTLSPGVHSVCAYATGLGPGPDYVQLGCGQIETMPPGTALGSGRRIVYANSGQWVWLVDGDGLIDSSYPVSGRYRDPPPGEYGVYGKWRWADAGHDGITMEYFVGFNPAGNGYGFHTIPTYADGTPLQGENELGQFRSAGCVRQRRGRRHLPVELVRGRRPRRGHRLTESIRGRAAGPIAVRPAGRRDGRG